jgi:hypothetical protein
MRRFRALNWSFRVIAVIITVSGFACGIDYPEISIARSEIPNRIEETVVFCGEVRDASFSLSLGFLKYYSLGTPFEDRLQAVIEQDVSGDIGLGFGNFSLDKAFQGEHVCVRGLVGERSRLPVGDGGSRYEIRVESMAYVAVLGCRSKPKYDPGCTTHDPFVSWLNEK